MHNVGTDKLKFLIGGVINTLLSYTIYLLLLPWLPYRTAFTLAYLVGILGGYAINTLWVFRKPWCWRTLFAYPIVPAINYFASLLIVHLTVEKVGLPEWLAPLLATIIVLPFSFLATRWLLMRMAH